MDVKRTFPAMPNGRRRVTDDDAAHVRLFEPAGNVALQDAAISFAIGRNTLVFAGRFAFAGDHQHEAQAAAMTSSEKSSQLGVRLILSHAMQIDAGFDLGASAADFADAFAIESRELGRRTRGGFWARCGGKLWGAWVARR